MHSENCNTQKIAEQTLKIENEEKHRGTKNVEMIQEWPACETTISI